MAGRFHPRRRRLVALSAAAGLLVVGWLATTPWLAEHSPRVLALALFLLVFVVPRLFVPERSAASLTGSTTRRSGAGWRTTASGSRTTSASVCSRRWPGGRDRGHRAVQEAGWRLTRAPDGRFTATPPYRRSRGQPGHHRRQPAGV
jgi:hypothetical protein